MSGNRIVLIGGGARSGKSAFALSRARSLGKRRVFVATAKALDAEMQDRISRHQAERGQEFRTIEESSQLTETLRALSDVDVVVVDCLTLWLSNLLLRDETQDRIVQRVDELINVLVTRRFHALIVTNEVGMGVVPESRLGRAFRDIAGLAHQRVAECADEIHLAILGTVLRIKPSPAEVQFTGEKHVDPE